MMKDTNLRSILKAVTYRVLASLFLGIVAYIYTGEIDTSLIILSADFLFKIIFFYIHERLWEYIKFGKNNKEK